MKAEPVETNLNNVNPYHHDETGFEIAIIGMAGRFPGAKNLEEYWDNLKKGIEAISFFSPEESGERGSSKELLEDPHFVKAGGVLDGVEYFDPSFFGYSPKEAEVMEPQTRLFHEYAWAALEDAGYDPETYTGLIGLYAGASSNFLWPVLAVLSGKADLLGGFASVQLTNKDFLCPWVSYRLNLIGPCLSVYTACSTSLVAVHTACQAVINGECDMALAGGVSSILSYRNGYSYQEGMTLSPDGHCRSFDARGKGTVCGEGIGIVVLKRLRDAVADGDFIHALIKGSASNNDGIRKVGFTAPSAEGQAEVIKAAQQMAEAPPRSIGYVEAHGTATELGDPIEIEALTMAFALEEKNCCAIGSVKSNIGHLDAAAGVAGLIKTVLILKHHLLPPSLHFETSNPNFHLENTSFYVNTRLRQWERKEFPLRAGVSSFGIGGTNAHVVLEEWIAAPAPDRDTRTREREDISTTAAQPHLILLSAKTPSALERASQNLARYLTDHPHLHLADVAYTLQVGRRAFPCRKKLVSTSAAEAAQTLLPGQTANTTRLATYLPGDGTQKKPLVFMFPGIGPHYLNMGRELYQSEPLFREEMDRCFAIADRLLGFNSKAILYPSEPSPGEACSSARPDNSYNSAIHQPEIAQLLLLAFEYALARLLIKWGITPDAVFGYSFGEYTAALLAGVFSLEEVMTLLMARGQLIGETLPGAMLSVPLAKTEITPLLTANLALAIDNGPSCVIAGPRSEVDAFAQRMKDRRTLCIRLENPHALHSPLMAPIGRQFSESLHQFTLKPPQLPFIANVTGTWITAAEAVDPGYWAKHLCQPVRFADVLSTALSLKDALFLEVGPGRTLSTLLKAHRGTLNRQGHFIIDLVRHPDDKESDIGFLLHKLGNLWLYGQDIAWASCAWNQKRRRISLPTYPFQGQRFWSGENHQQLLNLSSMALSTDLVKKPDVSDWFYIPSWERTLWPPQHFPPADSTPGGWLIFTDSGWLGKKILHCLQKENHEVIAVKAGSTFKQAGDRCFIVNPRREEDYETLFKELAARDLVPTRILHLWSITGTPSREPGLEITDRYLDRGFYSLLHIARALGKQSIRRGVKIVAVSDHMHEITGEEAISPAKVTLLAPVKVIPKEYPHISCLAVDIVLPEPGGSKAQALMQRILAEFHRDSESPGAVVAFHGNHRLVQTVTQVKLNPLPGPPPRLRPQGVYWITGGLGGIGLVIAEYLAKNVKAKLLLTGRSSLPAAEAWEKWLAAHPPEDPLSFKIRKIMELERLGAEVLVREADTADFQRMKAIKTAAEKRLGPINGIIHSAGVIDGAMIQVRNRDLSEGVFATKIKGTLVLDKLFKKQPLDFLFFCSSLSTALAPIGQVAYTAANLFMDAFAYYNHANQRGFTVSANWDAWQEVGMAHRDLKENETITDRITSREGVDAFARVLNRDVPQILVSTRDLPTWIQQHQSFDITHLEETLPGLAAADTLYQRPDLATPYAAPNNSTQQELAAIWQRFFGIEKIGIKDDFFELGGNSLAAMSLSTDIRKKLNMDVPLSGFFENSTIERLAAYIDKTEKQAITPLHSVEKKEYYDVSNSQYRLYFTQQKSPGNIAYNISIALNLQGEIDSERLALIIKRLTRMQESLRTSFHIINDRLVQRIREDVTVEIDAFAARDEEVKDIVNAFTRPFNLANAPLCRLGIVHTPGKDVVLLMDSHHIVSDGASVEVLVRDFTTLYAGEEVHPLRIQYRDYVNWLDSPDKRNALQRQKEYWLTVFAEEAPVTHLPYDYARPLVQSFAGNHLAFTSGEGETARLKALAVEEGVTLFMLLLAVYYAFLWKISPQDNIVVGTGVEGRNHEDLRSIIGMFVNILPLRNYPGRASSFRELLQEIKNSTLQAFENQEFQFEQLLEQIELEIDTSRNPLFDVMFQMENAAAPAQSTAPAPEAGQPAGPSYYGFANKTAKVDLTLYYVDVDNRLEFSIEYCTKLFKPGTIHWFSLFIKEIIARVLENPGISMREIKQMPQQRKAQILGQLNRRLRKESAAIPLKGQIQTRLTASLGRFKDNIALARGQQWLTYAQLDQRSTGIANELIRRGIGRGAFIGILMNRRDRLIEAVLGIIKAGSVFVPLDPAAPPQRLETMIRLSAARYVLCDDTALIPPGITGGTDHQDVCFIGVPPLGWSGDPHGENTSPGVCCHGEDDLYVYFTSGSTGSPRAMLGKNRSLLHFIHWEIDTFAVTPLFRFSQLTTPLFDAFLRDTLVPLCSGGTVCIPPSSDILQNPIQLIRWLDNMAITLMHMTPSLLRTLLEQGLNPGHFKSLQYILLSGERPEPADLTAWQAVFDRRIRLVNLWGTSETTLIKTCHFIQPDDLQQERIPIGKPLSGAGVLVLDENREICDLLVSGELFIYTPFRTKGYLNDPQLTRQRFIDVPATLGVIRADPAALHLHKTGDLGRLRPDGTLELLGRNDRQVKIRGIRIEPGEIESLLRKHPQVNDAVVIKTEPPGENNKKNEFLCAVFTGNHPLFPGEALFSNHLKEYLQQRLPGYMIPARLVKMETIPRLPNRKVDYREIRRLVDQPQADDTRPANETERRLLEFWSEILGIETPGVKTPFFHLGGNSLNLMSLITKIHKEFDLRISLGDIFSNPTVETQARLIMQARRQERPTWERAEEKEYYPLSSPQERIYVLHRMAPDSTAYNMPHLKVLEGEISGEKLEMAFKRLIQRHEILRTSFRELDGQPVQVIHRHIPFAISRVKAGEGEIPRIIEHFIAPFDLDRAPLLRVGLLQQENGDRILMTDMHHIIIDGGSFSRFIGELTILYSGEQLPELKTPYRDYSQWQRSAAQRQVIKKQAAYWKKEFDSSLPVLNLPIDYARPLIQDFTGQVYSFTVENEDFAALNTLVSREQVTMNIALMAIFVLMLSKVSGQEDLIVGMPMAGRRQEDLDETIGLMVNTMPLRHYPHSNKPWRQFLKEVKQQVIDAQENQEYPFEDLVEEITVQRDTSRNPIFDVLFQMERSDISPREIPDIQMTPFGFRENISKFDLTLKAAQLREGVFLLCEYSSTLFKRQTIEHFARYFREILRAVVSGPHRSLGEIKQSPGPQKERLLRQAGEKLRHDLRVIDQNPALLQDKLRGSFQRRAHAIALQYGDLFIAYGELDKRSAYIAAWLIDHHLSGGSLIGVLLRDRVAFLCAMIGILRAGCVFVPLDPDSPEQRLQTMIKDTNLRVLFSDTVQRDRLAPLTQETRFLLPEELIPTGPTAPPIVPRVPLSPEDGIYIYFTSGTTGTPRAILGKNRSLMHFIHWEIDTFAITDNTHIAQLTTPVFDAFLRDVLAPLCAGGTLCIPPDREVMLKAERLKGWLEETQVRLIHCVPSLLRVLQSARLTAPCLQDLKWILLSGEKIQPTHLVDWYQAMGDRIQLVNLWGTSETTLAKTCYFLRPEDIKRERIPVGRPLPGADVMVLDNNMALQDVLTVGELYIHTPFRTYGYCNDLELTNIRFLQSPLSDRGCRDLHKTGDLGRWLPDGNLDVLGRVDRQVKIRGIRLELEEIEGVLLKHPGVKEAAVLKKELSSQNEILYAFIAAAPPAGEQPALIEDLNRFLAARLPDYMRPARILALEKIPRKLNGKIDYHALPDPTTGENTRRILPADGIEEKIREIWSDLLGIDSPGVTDNFFQLGGNSLNLMALIARIHRELDLRISLAQIFNNPTIRNQAAIVKNSFKDLYPTVEPGEEKEDYELSPVQLRVYMVQQARLDSTAYHMTHAVRLEGQLEPGRLQTVFEQIIRRQVSFRTSFHLLRGQVRQKIDPEVRFEIETYEPENGEKNFLQASLAVVRNRFVRPFDLSRAPLLRVGLLSGQSGENVLMVDMHHIVADGISLSILVEEFTALYKGETLPVLKICYRDYAQWQNSAARKRVLKTQEKYWLQELRGDLPKLDLPLDFPRSPQQGFAGNSINAMIDKEETLRLKTLAQEEKVTLFMLLLAAFNVMLTRVSGQEDIIVGIPVANRDHPGLQPVIGVFANQLVSRNYPRGSKTFREFLQEVNERTIRGFANQDYSFTHLVERLALQRETGRNILFDVQFQMEEFNIPEVKIPDMKLEGYGLETTTVKLDLLLACAEANDTLYLRLDYNINLFKKETPERFIQYIKTVLRAVRANPQQPISQIEILSREKKQEISAGYDTDLEKDAGWA
jgi:amino acid adenylation domain-containing protein